MDYNLTYIILELDRDNVHNPETFKYFHALWEKENKREEHKKKLKSEKYNRVLLMMIVWWIVAKLTHID